ncbi:hypothetical protein CBL_20184, partial [Carabus blaptoides fortunei]
HSNEQLTSSITEIKFKSPGRKHATSGLHSSENIETPPKRSKIRRVTWRTPEKKIVRSLFQEHLANRTLQSEAVVMRIVKQEPELKSRTAAQITSDSRTTINSEDGVSCLSIQDDIGKYVVSVEYCY